MRPDAPPKTKKELENETRKEREIPFWRFHYFQVPAVRFRGCKVFELDMIQ